MNDDQRYQLHLGDCLEVMRTMEDNSCDSIVCDPPYALSFMGKAFDTFHEDGVSDNVAFQKAMTPIFKEALRVAKPGAHLLAFGGTRTYHRLACAIEDAGWEVRDCCFYCHGQGFPKGLDISKAIDKHLGAVREKKIIQIGRTSFGLINDDGFVPHRDVDGDEAVTVEAKKWQGYNTQLKPAVEPIVLARKPLVGTIVENVLKYGTGAINIDACRVPLADDDPLQDGVRHDGKALDTHNAGWGFKNLDRDPGLGRYPANLLHDGSPEVLACFPDGGKSAAPRPVNANRDGEQSSDVRYTEKGNTNFAMKPGMRRPPTSPARFFYCAKASRSERGEGNNHPTVKPLALMRWCVTLVAPPDSVVLDPFMGSGSTGIAALQCGCRFVGIEREPEYMAIAERRIAAALDEPPQTAADASRGGDAPPSPSPRPPIPQQEELAL